MKSMNIFSFDYDNLPMGKRTKREELLKFASITGVLKPGQFYRLKEGMTLWKMDTTSPTLRSDQNGRMTIILPDTMVMVTKKARWRYVQVVYEDMIGYVWCDPSRGIAEHFYPVDPKEDEEPVCVAIFPKLK